MHHRPHRRRAQRTPYRRPKHNVPVNIVDHGDRFTAHVYCAGFGREDVTVTVSGDVMYIAGQRTPAVDRPDFLLQEFPIKHFERWFELSEAADQSAITARVVDGVLEITVPKVAEAQRPDVNVPVG